MRRTSRRRQFLQAGSATGLYAIAGCAEFNLVTDGAYQVVRADGTPVEAIVEIYDTSDRTLLEQTRADPTLSLTTESLDGKELVAYQPDRTRPWFTAQPPARHQTLFHGQSDRLVLDQQLLFGPESGDVDYTVTVWRWVDPDDNSRHIFYIELLSQRQYFSNAMFSLTLPEDILVSYPETEGPFAAPIGLLANADDAQVDRWHATRQPNLPTHEMAPSWGTYRSYDDYAQRKKGREGANRIMMTAIGVIPIIGNLANLAETLSWATGGPEITNTIGDQYADPDANVPRPTGNTHDTIVRPWVDDLVDLRLVRSLVFEAPMQLPTADLGAQSLDLIAEAEWDDTNRFGTRIQLDSNERTPTPTRTSTPTTTPPQTATLIGCQGQTIYEIYSNGSVAPLVEGVKTKGVCASPDGTFWVTQQDVGRREEEIRNVDRDGNILTQFIPPDEGTRGIELDPDGVVTQPGRLYVVGHFNEAVFEMTQDGSTVRSYDVPAFEITDISIDSSGFIWLANQREDVVYRTFPTGGQLDVRDQWAPNLADRSEVDEVRQNPHTSGLAVDGSTVWVKDNAGIDIFAFDRRGRVQSKLDLPSSAPAMLSLDTPSGE